MQANRHDRCRGDDEWDGARCIHVRANVGAVLTQYWTDPRLGPRGVDLLSPVWHLFDLLPSGRGDFMPGHEE